MKKVNEMQYLSGVINQDHYYGIAHDKSSVKDISRKVSRIIENINSIINEEEKSTPVDSSKETLSAKETFTDMMKKVGTLKSNSLTGESLTRIENKADSVKKAMVIFVRKFESENPKIAAQIKTEAKKDATSLSGKIPHEKTEGVLAIVQKGAETIAGGVLWVGWQMIKTLLLQALKLVLRIASEMQKVVSKIVKNTFTIENKGAVAFTTICLAVIFPWLAFLNYDSAAVLLIPSGIYYMIITIGSLLRVGEID
jgi:hypothetical protein